MCGVFGFVVERPRSADEVLAGLRALEYRGYDSWGVAAADGPTLRVVKKVGSIQDKTLNFPDTDLAIGHTRWATTGGITPANAHPHLNENQSIAVVHNGIIENFVPLKQALQNRGHQFRSETDSEIVPHLYEEAKEKFADPLAAFRDVWQQLQGLNAIVLLDRDARRLFFGRRGSPLTIGQLADGYALASDGAALTGLAQQVVYLPDGWFGFLAADEIRLFSTEGLRRQPEWHALAGIESSADDGRFPYRMLQEIHEQPLVFDRLASLPAASFQQAAGWLRSAGKVFVVGCGTAHYAGQIGSALLAAAGWFAPAVLANEAAEIDSFMDAHTVLIALSQSGETIDLLTPLAAWQKRGAKIIALVNVPFSSLDRMADLTLHLQAGWEKSVASTKAFTAQLATLNLLSAALSDHFSEGKRQLEIAGKSAKKLLSDSSWQTKIVEMARELGSHPNLFMLGRGRQRYLALESALKLKEISYLHAEGMAAGELKHGPLALIESGVPCLLFWQTGQEAETETTARELKARGGLIFGIGPARLAVFDHYLPVSGEGLANLVDSSLALQLLAYQVAVQRGCNPDRPRNLAKSVTVK